MFSEPTIQYRKKQPFLVIRKKVHMYDIPSVLPPLIPEVMKYMADNNIEEAGPAFFHYLSIDEKNELVTATGVPVKNPEDGVGNIEGGFFPEGNYATILYTGDYKFMMDAHKALEAWIHSSNLKEQVHVSDGETIWGGRTEFYLNGPDEEPDPEKLQTLITFLLAKG
jgi:effector-binding domain-containing protein